MFLFGRFHSKGWGLLVVCCLVQLGSQRPAVAQNETRASLAKIAAAAKWAMRQTGAQSVAIGQFTGPPAFGSAAGPGIQMGLTEELGKLGIRTARLGADLGIQGRFYVRKQDNWTSGVIEASLVDGNGQVLQSLNGETEVVIQTGNEMVGSYNEPVEIKNGIVLVQAQGTNIRDHDGSGALAQLLGATVDLKPPTNQTDDWRDPIDTVVDTFKNPTAYVNRNYWVSASRQSPFSVAVLSQDRNKPIELQDGQPFVNLALGEAFQISLNNAAGYPVAAVVTLDGVNSFAFSKTRYTEGPKKGEPKYNRWILSPGKSLTLKGWEIDDETVKEFLVTDFANSAAAKMRSTNDVGAISVVFRRVWKAGTEPPEDEGMMAMAPAPGIGVGSTRKQRTRATKETWESGMVRAVVTIRYTKPQNADGSN